MKTIVITGTSRGLGSEIVGKFRSLNWNVVELNRPYFDIQNCSALEIPDFDVFINNAYNYDFSQVELLYKLYDKFKNKKCTIISIGSVSGDGDRNRLFPYAIHKSALEKASTQLSLLNTECKICLIKPGRINTDMTKNRAEYYRMSPSEIMDVIEFILSRPEKLIIKSITIDVHNSNMVI